MPKFIEAFPGANRPDQEKRVSPEQRLISNPAVVALITHVGPFNYREWQEISRDEKHAANIATDQLKDYQLIAEGARPGAGNELLKYVARVSPSEVDLPALNRAEDLRTQVPLVSTYVKNPFMLNISSYFSSGTDYRRLDCTEETEAAERFSIITDLGHFSRIMQKDIAKKDDVVRSWLADEVGVVFERNLNDAFTHRGEGIHGEHQIYPVPPQTTPEGNITVAEQNVQGQVLSITSERQSAPNITYMLSITHPENFKPKTVRVSQGRGNIGEKELNTSEEMLRYLSAQYESLLLSYPAEKATLIFDKFLYLMGIGDQGIQMAFVQRVKDKAGKLSAKVITVGNPAVAFLKEQSNTNTSQQEQIKTMRTDTPDDTLVNIALQVGVPKSDIPSGALSPRQKQRLIGLAHQIARKTSVAMDKVVHSDDQNAALGTLHQTPHRITTFEIEETDSLVILPPSISSNSKLEQIKDNKYTSMQDVIGNLNKLKGEGSNVSISSRKLNSSEVQVVSKEPWTKEEVLGQIEEYTGHVAQMLRIYDQVFIDMQFAHFHPTGPKHTSIQEEAADIAFIIGSKLKEMGANVQGRSLVDEYHTDDRMQRWEDYFEMLRARAGEFATEFIQESSPVMRLIGDAQTRMMLEHPNTLIRGGTLEHNMPDGRVLELWDGAQDNQGNMALGRQACVPFNTGMDVALMDPDRANKLYQKYLVERYPDSTLASVASQHPELSIHDIIGNLMLESDITKRNESRLQAINQVDRESFSELAEPRPDISAFDLLVMDEMHKSIKQDIANGKRIPIVTHILETNYNAQQTKAEYMWGIVGIPEVPIFRISFNPESHKIRVLTSPPPEKDYAGEFLARHADAINQLRARYLQS